MTLQTLIIRYALFAILAMVANLAIQRGVLHFGDSVAYFVGAIGAGTIAGLVIKYLLDKRWIFFDPLNGVRHHSRTFSLYTAMGFVTTVIFWGTETAFWLIWETHLMREIGAILGLGVGYVIKYNLDRRYVFMNRHLAESA